MVPCRQPDAAETPPPKARSLQFGRLPMGYGGNLSREDRHSAFASHKKILLKTPCPGRNLPEDTCCFDLSGMTGFWCNRFRPAAIARVPSGPQFRLLNTSAEEKGRL